MTSVLPSLLCLTGELSLKDLCVYWGDRLIITEKKKKQNNAKISATVADNGGGPVLVLRSGAFSENRGSSPVGMAKTQGKHRTPGNQGCDQNWKLCVAQHGGSLVHEGQSQIMGSHRMHLEVRFLLVMTEKWWEEDKTCMLCFEKYPGFHKKVHNDHIHHSRMDGCLQSTRFWGRLSDNYIARPPSKCFVG